VSVAGLTISHPALSSLPLGILSITAHAGNPRFRPELDPNDIRQATTRSGVSVWIIPGVRSLCVAEVDKPRFPFLGGGGAGMSCSRDIASAVADGSGLSSGSPGGITWHYGVLPNTTPTLTIRTGPHRHKTIQPPDGVYIYRTTISGSDSARPTTAPVAPLAESRAALNRAESTSYVGSGSRLRPHDGPDRHRIPIRRGHRAVAEMLLSSSPPRTRGIVGGGERRAQNRGLVSEPSKQPT